MFWILFTFSVTCTTPTLISSLHVDSRCFHSFRPGEGFLYVSYNCQPCNYRIWTKPLGPRVGLLVCVYICIYTHTHTYRYSGCFGATVWTLKCESEQPVTEVASGRTAPRGRVCHLEMNALLTPPFTRASSLFPWHWQVEYLFWHGPAYCR